MSTKEELQELIKEKKSELAQSRKGSEGWKSGPSKNFGGNQASKLKAQALEKEINDLYEQIRLLGK